MRIVVVMSLFGVATSALLGYDYQPNTADLPVDSEYPNVGALELNTFAPNSGVDSYGLDVRRFNVGLNKEFYHYSAPEEDLPGRGAAHSVATRIKKNLRVVFIKAPDSYAATKAALLRLAKQSISDQTAIYVLSKETDVSELAKEIQDIRSASRQKPEVRFVKYRTPEDAASLQFGIQQQYEALRGPSRYIDEGAAPVLDFSASSQIDEGVNGAADEIVDGSTLISSTATAEELHSPSGEGREYIPPSS